MAVVGQQLTAAEAGWKRLESTGTMFTRTGAWTILNSSDYSGGSTYYTTTANDYVEFYFYGDRFRLIESTAFNRPTKVAVYVDGTLRGEYSLYSSGVVNQVLVYELLGLSLGRHVIRLVNKGSSGQYFTSDAVDLAADAYIPAMVGQPLLSPEAGWRRYDDKAAGLVYNGTWTNITNSSAYLGAYTRTNIAGSYMEFKFVGSMLRIISPVNTDLTPNVSISVDGVSAVFSEYRASLVWTVLVFEKLGLEFKEHTVQIRYGTSGYSIVDAIDIDANGYLVLPDTQPNTGGQLRPRVAQAQIGDYVRCSYSAASGVAGQFTGLGDSELVLGEIPLSGANLPNGHFYFVKVASNLLVADRNIQTGVSWNVLNASMLARGTLFNDSLIPVLTSNIGTNGVASCSTMYSTAYDAWKAFDRVNTQASVWATVNGTRTGWLGYTFNQPVLVQRYTIRARNAEPTSAPRRWTLEAFDGESWIILHSAEYSRWVGDDEQTFSFYNTFMYQKYRLNILENNGHASYVSIADFRLCTDYESCYVRMPKGGRAYLGADGYSATVDEGKGAFPVNNEWDVYLTRSKLSTAVNGYGEGVWHYAQNALGTWCMETDVSAPSSMTLRGKGGTLGKREALGFTGLASFRPVLEIIPN